MLLAIKGEINSIYKLTNREIKLVEKYLKGISHKRFKESKANTAFSWLGIEPTKEFPTFIQCEKRLKNLGYVSRNKDLDAIKITSKKGNKDYKKIYAKEESEIIKKMPGEFELKRINTSMQENSRSYFLWYIAGGGSNTAFGDFKGKVIQIEKDKGILFKEIYVEFDEMDGSVVKGKEDHVWIFDCQEFLKMGIQVGDCVKFNALAYAYKRQDGTIDFALKAPQWIQYIPDYELPKDEDLNLQAIKRIICETCLYNKHCYGESCIAAPGYKEIMTVQLLEASGASKEFVDKYILNHPIPNSMGNVSKS